MAEWSSCDYYRGVGTCSERWRNCAFYGEPKCVTDEPMPPPCDEQGRFVSPRNKPGGVGMIAEFLLARFAEDEASAGTPDSDETEVWGIEPSDYDWPRISPRRILAECEAKRQIVERAQSAERWAATEQDGDYDDDGREYAGAVADAWTEALRLLALPYRDHPDFRPEWNVRAELG